MFSGYAARYRALRQHDAVKPDGFAADSRAEDLAIRAGNPAVESLELRQHRITWRASRRRVGLDRVQALQRSSDAVAPAPQQGQFKICLLAEVESELAATF